MNDLQIRQMQISAAKDEIRCCNELNQIYGLTLTEADITELEPVHTNIASISIEK